MQLAVLSLVALATTAAAANSGFLAVKTYPAGQRIGCVTANGRVSTTGCASFTLTDDNKLLQGSNQCSVGDNTQPENTDAIYGRGVVALACAAKYNGQTSTTAGAFYTVSGADNNLCTGNLRCSWDLKTSPGSGVPAWPFVWGSQQKDVPPGHVHVQFEFSATA